MARRYAAKVDGNQNDIVKGLRTIFGDDVVFDCSAVGRGFPDIMVGVRGRNLLMEIKTDKGKLTPDQVYFHRQWGGKVHVIHSLQEALKAIEDETT